MKQSKNEIKIYDEQDTSGMIDLTKQLRFEDLGLQLPAVPPPRKLFQFDYLLPY
ncbi:MAG: hypothetical protein HYU97_07480 [Deltaproteobacteria bacterium]|nr:hypothetical protein [Deltaproteobacteria bacterium]